MTPDKQYIVQPHDPLPIELREITKDEYEQIKRDSQTVSEFEYYIRRFREIELNKEAYYAIKDYYLEIFEKSEKKPVDYDYKLEAFIELNRCFTNFISSFTSLMEHCEKKLIRLFSTDSSQFTSFKSDQSSIYDSELAYRLLYNLRNYSIHSNFPIENVNFNKIKVADNNYRYEIIVSFSKQRFQKSKTLKKKMGIFMNSFDEKEPVCTYPEKLMPLIETLLKKFIELVKPEFKDSAKNIVNLSNEFGEHIGITIPKLKGYNIKYKTIILPVVIAVKLS